MIAVAEESPVAIDTESFLPRFVTPGDHGLNCTIHGQCRAQGGQQRVLDIAHE